MRGCGVLGGVDAVGAEFGAVLGQGAEGVHLLLSCGGKTCGVYYVCVFGVDCWLYIYIYIHTYRNKQKRTTMASQGQSLLSV